jgi:fucose permease
MYILLITIIYVAFINLGLPDALLGSAWPVIQRQLDVPLHYAGMVSMLIFAGTIVASLLSDRLTHRFNTGLVTATGVVLTATALFGFSVSGSFWMLCVFAVPYGLGAGSVDAAINNYVAVHYTSRHMNWLHCFWGLGAMAGPYIMGFYLTGGLEWSGAYRTVALIQIIFAAVLFLSLPLWKKRKKEPGKAPRVKGLSYVLRIKGVKYVLLAFFAYCAMESTAGLWASTYLVEHRGVGVEAAAWFASLFFIGITSGRFLSGIVSNKLGDKTMIKIGIGLILAGIGLILVPFEADMFSLAGLIITGLGCAPVFPSIIHSTPYNFGVENSQAIVGVQMASAYTGSALMPPLFGLMASSFGLFLYPIALLFFTALMIVMLFVLNKTVGNPLEGKIPDIGE